jgi:hypothetical protein
MRSDIAANDVRGTATSASWDFKVLEREGTSAPIPIRFARSVLKLHRLTSRGRAN